MSKQSETDSPQWVLRELVKERLWEIGDVDSPVRLKTCKEALEDFRYLAKWQGKKIYLTDLPCAVNKVNDVNEVVTRSVARLGSDDVSDEKALAAYRAERRKLTKLVEDSIESGDVEGVLAAKEKLQHFDKFLNSSTRPGGHLAKLNNGDPFERLINTERKRFRDLDKLLRKVGLSEVAEHIRSNVIIWTSASSGDRLSCYLPDNPIPEWVGLWD